MPSKVTRRRVSDEVKMGINNSGMTSHDGHVKEEEEDSGSDSDDAYEEVPSQSQIRRRRKRGRYEESEEEEEGHDDNQVENDAREEEGEEGRDEDNKEMEVDDGEGTTIPTPLKQVNKPGKPAEAGIIKRVYVENFMCHGKLTVDLCRNVNFIHGQNGSGKSAILAAIQICLGAGAKRTHRARNLKELVRKEAGASCTGAKVRVTLLNKGEDGFQKDKYGDAITVERCISLRGGYNGYKLLDEHGKEQSRSKKDLDAMLDQLNIQVENPVAVLDQEEAKKFLCGKPEDKYQFFCKATELERIDRYYASVLDNVEELNEKAMNVRQSLSASADNVKRLKAEWEQFQELEKLEDKLLDQKVMYAWSCYNVLNNKVQEQEQIAKEVEDRLSKKQQELTKAEEAANVTDDEEHLLKERMKQLTEEAQEAATAKASLETELKKAMAPVKQHEREASSIKREIHQAKKRLKAAQKHLQDAREQILAAAGNAKTEEARRMENLKRAEEDLTEARSLLDPQKQAVSESLRKFEELEPHVDQAKQNAQSVTNQLHAVRKKIQDLQSASGSSFAVFGQKCAAMHAKVEAARKARKFRGRVVGPIGVHIKIAPGKEQYAKIAEHAIGASTLDRFIVTNDADRQLYMKLRREVGCSTRDCGVFQMHDGQRYDVPSPPTSDVETVASVLNIEDDLVFNCLVDNARIDLRALAVSKEASEKALLIKQPNGKDAILGGKIKEVFFLPHGDHWQVKHGTRTMISNEKQLKQTIGIDRTAAIEDAKRELEILDSELKDCRAKEADLLNEQKEYRTKWHQANREHTKTKKQIEKLQSTIDDLKAEAENAETFTIDTTELEEDVNGAEDALEQLKEKEAECQKSLEALLPGVDGVKKRLDETTMRNEKVLEDLTEAEKKIEEHVKGRAQRQANVDKKRSKLAQLEDVIEKQKEVISEIAEKRSEAMYKARLLAHSTLRQRSKAKPNTHEGNGDNTSRDAQSMDFSEEPTQSDLEAIEPIVTDKEPSYYKAKIERAVKQIERERQRRQMSETNPEVALEKYLRAKQDLDSKMFQIESIEKNVKILVSDMKTRRKRWKQFRSHIALATNEIFDEMLNKKGSSGQIDFDHSDRTLNLIVQKDNANAMSQTKDVKALSGGERSFTTLSLLLALGENLETPFRVMDEFDVFLDAISRKIALDTMVSVAKDMQHRQFIFITPQDLSSLKTDPMLKIFHMKAPKRTAIVGGPTQQTLDFESPPTGA